MRIVIDRQLCKGHAVCMSEAPEVFSVSTMGTLTLLKASPSEAERLGVEAAVKYCPTGALSLESGDGS